VSHDTDFADSCDLEFQLNLPTNDNPVLQANLAQTVNEDEELDLNIELSDADFYELFDDGLLLVDVVAVGGTVSLPPRFGIHLQTGSGVNDAVLQFRAGLNQAKVALADMTYTSNLHYHGAGSVTVDVSDRGYSGAGGAKTDSLTITITITDVNDTPIFSSCPVRKRIDEDTTEDL
jgi:hypothetical protein